MLTKLTYDSQMKDTPEVAKGDFSHCLVGYNMTGVICAGDSGGPALKMMDNGQFLLIGTIICIYTIQNIYYIS